MATKRAPLALSPLDGISRELPRNAWALPLPALRLGLAERSALRRLGDLVAIASPWLVTAAAGARLDPLSPLLALSCWLVAALLLDSYHPARGARPSRTLGAAFLTLPVAALLFAALAWAVPVAAPGLAPRPATAMGYLGDLATVAALLGGWQLLFSQVIQQAAWRSRVLILGQAASARATARTLRLVLGRDYTLAGFVAGGSVAALPPVLDGVRVLGSASQLPELVSGYRVDLIVLAHEEHLDAETLDRLAEAREQGAEIVTMYDFYRTATGRLPLEDGPAFRQAALTTPRTNAELLYPALKRLMDVLAALLGLGLLALVVPFVALANALESPGPLFYTQMRVGLGGRVFRILKFRSMVVDAERPGEARWARRDDRRVTRVGRLLRRTHLDEVPQLWNVLKGDMSLVGPRPERPELIGELRRQIPCYSARHAVRPGLTGWAQVNYRYGSEAHDALIKLEYDLYYIQQRGLWLDLVCVLRTVRSVLMLTGT